MSKRSNGNSRKHPDFSAEVTICLPINVESRYIRFLFGTIEPNGQKRGGQVFIGPRLSREIAKMANQNGKRVTVTGHIRQNDERYRDDCPFKLHSIIPHSDVLTCNR